MELAGKVAVVTGAAGGIGRAIARSLAVRGCHVALADVNEDGLTETAALIGNSVRVTRHSLDVANRDAVAAFPAVVLAAHGHVDVVVNNAGVALSGSFAQLTEAEFDWLLDINLHGVVRMSRAFLPLLQQREQAQLVNLSSLFGIIAPPGQSAYAGRGTGGPRLDRPGSRLAHVRRHRGRHPHPRPTRRAQDPSAVLCDPALLGERFDRADRRRSA
ncbi:SDR family oxidoreductase [Sphingomonas ginsenosidivorax]|uniref:SDR family oxidoreductase n=2 Tax=Sphingomonas ginsenosidivorax TaxID=862135 RepID=A0A5C6UJK2_9SPHN|nr:SDR family oxidoreductase [Sphingomonas ginsenosidivorax]